MGVTRSIGVGKTKGSVGEFTYRVVRGRCISSQRKLKGASGLVTRGLGGNNRKAIFAMINMFMAEHASDLQVSFNRSVYGSQRNYFFKANYKALSQALLALASTSSITGEAPSIEQIEAAITDYASTHPNSIYRVKLAGFQTVYMSGAWTSDDNPISGGATDGLGTGTVKTTFGLEGSYDAPASFSMSFHAGAKIVRDAGTVHIKGSALPDGVTAASIAYLTTGNTPVEVAITSVVSSAGSLQYKAPALTSAQNIVAIRVASVYVRLSSAYVKTEDDPTA